MSQLSKQYINDLSYEVLGAIIEVHKIIGPGLIEDAYHRCLIHEFNLRNLSFQTEMPVQVMYKGEAIGTNLRCDFLVEDALVVELKCVKEMHPVFEAQLLTYMKLLKKPKGLLVNFFVKNMFAEGQRSYVNDIFRELPEE